MPSPFPGMDPYLERFWGDVHTSIVTYARDALQRQLPAGVRARIEEHVEVQEEEVPVHRYRPDVQISESAGGSATAVATDLEQAAEPFILWSEVATQRSLQIIDVRAGGRVITTVEMLSPANKTTERDTFRRKQREMMAGGVNLVEIDLLRGGQYALSAPAGDLPEEFLQPYLICVTRGHLPNRYELYRAPLGEPLPTIRIPLRPNDSDVVLRLQNLIDQSYENGGYDDIDYTQEPQPPFSEQEAAWAAELLKEKRGR